MVKWLPFCPKVPSWNMAHCWGKTKAAPASQQSEAGINYSGRNLQKHREQSGGLKKGTKKKKTAGHCGKPHHAPVYAAQVQAHHWGCFSCGLAQTLALWDGPLGSALIQPSPHCHHQAFLSSLLWLPWNIYVPPHPHNSSCLVAQSQEVCLERLRARHRAPSLGWWVLPLQSHTIDQMCWEKRL